MNKKTILSIALGVVLLIGAFIVYLLVAGTDPEIEKMREGAEGQFDDPTQQLEEFAAGGFRITYETVLKDYQNWSRYPPDSRPLRPEYRDEIQHQIIELPFTPMPLIDAEGKPVEGTHRCRLQPLEHTVVEGKRMEVQLVCENIQSNQPVATSVSELSLVRYLDTQTWQVPTPEVEAGTAANQQVTRILYTPRREDWGNMDLSVKFTIPGEKPAFTHELKVHFFSSPVAPAYFTGTVQERLADGSLVLPVEVDVKIPGRYEIQGNLFTAEDKPIARARAAVKLGTGRHFVDLSFFGKLFHDSGHSGPYVLKGLRGIQDTDALDPELLKGPPEEVERLLNTLRTTEPDRRVIPTWPEKYTTQAYKLSDFSDREYDSEFKRERIEELKKLAESD
ncbi:MAG: hypothetical protein HS115_02565 [Spirochaetales bacterium]|nr:hypothetical protein [Spirochaetales bacterium]